MATVYGETVMTAWALRWQTGQPPHIGWWNTSNDRQLVSPLWTWWDGERWSWSAPNRCNASVAAVYARSKSPRDLKLCWRWHWPITATVARINPATGEVTGAGPMPGTPVNWLALAEIYGHGEGAA